MNIIRANFFSSPKHFEDLTFIKKFRQAEPSETKQMLPAAAKSSYHSSMAEDDSRKCSRFFYVLTHIAYTCNFFLSYPNAKYRPNRLPNKLEV